MDIKTELFQTTKLINNGVVSYTKIYHVHFPNGLFLSVPFLVYDEDEDIEIDEILEVAKDDWRSTASKEFADSCLWKGE